MSKFTADTARAYSDIKKRKEWGRKGVWGV